MVRRPFSTNPSYLQYIRSLRELHALTMAGRDESPEADAIRDGMDHPWYDLSETEQERINGLSADLYSISDTPKEPQPTNPQVQRKLIEADEAWQAGNWDQALEILRRWSQHIDPAILSYRRGRIWHEAGDDATANLFYGHAARLDPRHFEHAYLHNLWSADDLEGRKLAREILAAREPHSVEIVITASAIVFLALREIPIFECREDLEVMASALERAISRARADDLAYPQIKNRTIKNLLVYMACSQERMANSRSAIGYLNEALAIDPFDVGILLIRGVIGYGIESSAVDDFERVTEFGARNVWPGFYLAHHSFVTSRFEDCRNKCEWALTFPAPDGVRALLNEWLGISKAELGYPPIQVQSAFEEALRLAPDSDRIRNNLAKFEQSSANPGGPIPDWIRPMASTVKAFGRLDFQPPWPSFPIAA
jgi:tetratricopeptide (TPR) repeat protein